MFEKILIANRGEIACRVIRTAKEMGYRTVAVYSEADRHALHVRLADEAVCIGPATASESYLKVDAILDACTKSGADAVHPGYGFLSENADFARACEKANVTFIGPPVDAIHLMGSKRLSKIAMIDAGVPCIPGYEGEDQTDKTLMAEATRIGLPLMIKASAGGGGRGMRVVTDTAEIADQLKGARTEAKNAFGSDELILERAVMRPRHVEIQVFGDQHGNVIHLGERDCSVQRRHQKVVEEAPSPAVDKALRARMGQAAVEAAKSCNYVGAGTVEFLLDASGEFYFLEMNTRLQVEHPVTELVTGLDLVALQIRVARGETLPITQEQVQLNGHAIEVRLYAEDPSQNFLPQTGEVMGWRTATGPGIRIDHGLRVGQVIGSHYDPMLAKLIAWGESREDARRRLIRAIEDTVLIGVQDNRTFLANILKNPAFANGEATTAFIGSEFADDPSLSVQPLPREAWAIGALLRTLSLKVDTSLRGWHSAAMRPQPLTLVSGEQRCCLTVEYRPAGVDVMIDDKHVCLRVVDQHADYLVLEIDGVRTPVPYHNDGLRCWFSWRGQGFALADHTHTPHQAEDGPGSGQVRAPMDGLVLDVRCEVGQTVNKGQVLAVMEAMKMEHSLKAGVDGTIESVSIQCGDQVKGKQVVLTIVS
ncbi:MAG: acetyl/propionyl/methylcrotonyl-CoA carboxylase subunit alpha [Alcanivoracaceae bacterium]|nr:acetyl/propionyl/methylcrotonyl-CoA carboxylase subunit alpha [Alcanivoracaceae bacterium]